MNMSVKVDFRESLGERLKGIIADLREEYLLHHSTPWIIGFSGGKDSTLLAQLVMEMLLALRRDSGVGWYMS